ncbi:hypothetical protein [Desulfobacula sp.]|uniref:hypothetical protein n=1 Tax=Desulfobacula sp. TaxID=2593537 RepID=UPI00263930B0|nr:hypothetical protein [Desulfobacula sp.]
MQQIKRTVYEKCVTGVTGTVWIAGLLISGSDSPYMPWLNGMGLFLFLGATLLLGKCLQPSHHTSGTRADANVYKELKVTARVSQKINCNLPIPCEKNFSQTKPVFF